MDAHVLALQVDDASEATITSLKSQLAGLQKYKAQVASLNSQLSQYKSKVRLTATHQEQHMCTAEWQTPVPAAGAE